MDMKRSYNLPLEVDWNFLTLMEIDALLKDNVGYIDGDKKKIIIMVKLIEG